MSDTNQPKDTPLSTEKEMTFVEHLEELRQHLIRSFLAVFVFSIFIFTATDFIFENILFAPTRPDFATYHFLCWLSPYLGMAESLCYNPSKIQVVTLAMGEAFSLHIKICFLGGIVLAFPYLLWELWRFIKPGLHEHERKAASNLVGVGSFLFLLGISFGYFVLAPFGINFLVNYNLPLINTQGSLVQAGSYLNYLIMFTIPVGLVFQLPIVIFYLARVGIVTDVSMRTYRRHAIVVILIIAAIITPPDVISQIFVSIPVYILYEISISIAAKQAKLKAERDALEEA